MDRLDRESSASFTPDRVDLLWKIKVSKLVEKPDHSGFNHWLTQTVTPENQR